MVTERKDPMRSADRGRVLDPISLEVTRHALDGIVEEMVFTILRTARSSVVKLNMDFSTALCMADGTLIAQGITSAMHLGAIPDAMAAIVARYGGRVHADDVFITNDPYDGGMHIPDVFVVKPLFHDGALVAFAVTVCHHVDMGGRVPGSVAADSTEIYQEGLRIPVMRLVEQGTFNETLTRLIEQNVRIPEMVLGDLHAQIAACTTAARSFADLVGRSSCNEVLSQCRELVDYSERLTRAAISQWADGTYTFVDHIDDDGTGSGPLPIAVALTVEGDRVIVDFEGTAGQTRGAINATLSSTKAVVYAAVRYLLPLDVPNNEGFFRAVEVRAPTPSVVNVTPPGACAARGITMFRVFDAVLGALAAACPGRVFAACEGGAAGISFGGTRGDGSRYVFLDFVASSWGARPDRDGVDGTATPAGNGTNEPIEIVEAEYPIRIEQYGYVPDTGGPGRYRGGLGIVRSYRLLEGEAVLHVRANRSAHAPYGLEGGFPGSRSRTVLVRDDVERPMPGTFTERVRAGDLVVHELPGGGGYGPPGERDAAAVRHDLLMGKLTATAAARDYGLEA